jgi:hypothetical protein
MPRLTPADDGSNCPASQRTRARAADKLPAIVEPVVIAFGA